MKDLERVVALSHQYGTPDYVKGGGGNTSVKDADTIWIKPSGTVLKGLSAPDFVAVDRAAISAIFDRALPQDRVAQEEAVKQTISAAVRPDSSGRPSVELLLHNLFDAKFVVHTHPPLVNGLTCAQDGPAVCPELFPDSLWVDYIDPGYTLSVHLRGEMEAFVRSHGRQPDTIFLKNHGIFVAGDTETDIDAAYGQVLDTLLAAYGQKGIALELLKAPPAPVAIVEETVSQIRQVLGAETAVAYSPRFDLAEGPVTPDHIVYHKAWPLTAPFSAEAVVAFHADHGYNPRIIQTEQGVFSTGTSPSDAALALELAGDGALIKQLAVAFGGIEFMDARATDFIEQWEVESYRRSMMKA